MLLSATWMLRHLGLELHAAKITDALMKVVSEGKVRTPDLGGTNTTTEFVKAVMKGLH